MDQYRTPTLGLTEAYHVAHRWLDHIGATPESIIQPVDGVVELRGGTLVARIKLDRAPLAQSSILALLKTIQEHNAESEHVHCLLFSVTGFSDGAKTLAESHNVGLFDLDAIGDVHPVTTYARNMMPAEPLEPAFLFVPGSEDEEEKARAEQMPFGPIEKDPKDWLDCPRCGATHHKKANFCAACGADLTARSTLTAKLPPQPAVGMPQPMLAPQAHSIAGLGGATLRCRTCGSQDIELIDPRTIPGQPRR
jgi:ribosomal protein L37E